MKNIISLPKFGGFYQEYFTDNYLECEREHNQAEHPEASDDEIEAMLPEIDYTATYKKVAEHCVTCNYGGYAEKLTEAFPDLVKSVEFHSLDSPEYYNFRTDEILAVVDYDYILLNCRIFVEQRETFEAWLKENYTSRDGFISFIETDIQDFIAGLKEEQPTDIETVEYSKYLTVIFQYLCRDWDIIDADMMDGTHECIITE